MSTRAGRRSGRGRTRLTARLARALRGALVLVVLTWGTLQFLGQPATAERAVTHVTDATSRVFLAAVTRLADALTDVLTDAMRLNDPLDTTNVTRPTGPHDPAKPTRPEQGPSDSTGDKDHADDSERR